MMTSYKCNNVNEAMIKFPHLKNTIQTEIKTKDGFLTLFTDVELTEKDKKLFEKYTSQEINRSLSNDGR